MPALDMTYSLAMAIAHDAANANMKRHKRNVWNTDDFSIYVLQFHKLWPCPDDGPCDLCNPD